MRQNPPCILSASYQGPNTYLTVRIYWTCNFLCASNGAAGLARLGPTCLLPVLVGLVG